MKDPENAARWVKAYWADDAKEDYKATLELDCMDRANLLSVVRWRWADMRVRSIHFPPARRTQGRGTHVPDGGHYEHRAPEQCCGTPEKSQKTF